MISDAIDWMKPSPLWGADGQDFRKQDFFRPTLLEFRTDSFMDEFLAAVAAPQQDALQTAVMAMPEQGASLKLFQPVHGCFYLVNASLCCREAGFPDRQVQLGNAESVFFVLRKLINGVEYGWIAGAAGRGWWASLEGQPRRLLDGEERMPMFNAATSNCRAVFAGYLPVSSSQTYKISATQLQVPTKNPAISQPVDTRIEELGSRFTSPLTIPDGGTTSLIGAPDNTQALTLSVYLILDLYEYLVQYLPDVAGTLRGTPPPSLSAPKTALIHFLDGFAIGGSVTLGSALRLVAQQQAKLNMPGGVSLVNNAAGVSLGSLGFTNNYNFKLHAPAKPKLEDLIAHVRAALPAELPPIELPKLAQQSNGGADRYIVRCCYERPLCAPTPLVVSLPSLPFQLAQFFDPDAPARPIRIPLPSDVSIAGMRKFKKNVSFMMSDAMRKKMAAITGKEQGLLKGENNLNPEDGLDLAFICSFSIQIIFIIAFFLLMIFAIVLNFVFWWLPFFKICFPLPKRVLPD